MADTEACDDGNLDNADGCSEACEVSGTIAWSVSLPGGFSVGLSARENRAVVAVQQYANEFDPTIVLAGYDKEGLSFGEYADVGGFSDKDLALSPVALLPSGRVALGYVAVAPRAGPGPILRSFGILDFERGIVGSYVDESRTGVYYGTAYQPQGPILVRSIRDDEGEESLLLQQFDENAAQLHSLPLGLTPSEHRPLFRGAVPERLLSIALLFSQTANGEIELHTSMLASASTYSNPVATALENTSASSFSDAAGLHLWTGTELLSFDEQDHVIDQRPMSIDGDVLWADEHGLVVSRDGAIVLYDETGEERLSVELPQDSSGESSRPQYVRPDLQREGLFLVTDVGVPADVGATDAAPVNLHYIVR